VHRTIQLTSVIDPGSIVTALGGWTTITPSGLLIVVVVLFMLGRIFPLSTLKRAWEETDKAWAAYRAERDARQTAEAAAQKALDVLVENNRILDNLRPRGGDDGTQDRMALERREGSS
jgi:hypothetical protein